MFPRKCMRVLALLVLTAACSEPLFKEASDNPSGVDAGPDADASDLEGSSDSADAAPPPPPPPRSLCDGVPMPELGDECENRDDCGGRTCRYGFCVTRVFSPVTGDNVWTAEDSPYWITQHTQVGGHLKVEPGVRILGEGYSITTFGVMELEGTNDAPIELHDVHLSAAGSVDEPATLHVKFARFWAGSFMGVSGQSDAGGFFRLEDSQLRCVDSNIDIYAAREAVFARNDFYRTENLFLSLFAEGGVPVVSRLENNRFKESGSVHFRGAPDTSLVARHNSFLDFGKGVAVSEGPADFKATENYWGTTDVALIEKKIRDANDDLTLEAVIPYEPILAEPHPLTPVPEK